MKLDLDLNTITPPAKTGLAAMAAKYRGHSTQIRALIAAKISTNCTNVPGAMPGEHEGLISVKEAAAAFGISAGTVSSARRLLREGSPDEVTAVLEGRAGINIIRVSPKSRERAVAKQRLARKIKGSGTSAADPLAEMLKRLGEAIQTLATMPSAKDVAALISGRRGVGDMNITAASKWLGDFDHELSKAR